MDRESARDNPQAPLIHHYTDSTHVTPGVLTVELDLRGVALEASWFRGEEPDENRLNLDWPKLDSWSARAAWRRGSWLAQVSGGHLHRPELFELFDTTRLTASVEYAGAIVGRRFAASAIWGENRDVHGILDGYLAEWDVGLSARGSLYGRGNRRERSSRSRPRSQRLHRVSPYFACRGADNQPI
jgi:hypothetical protein